MAEGEMTVPKGFVVDQGPVETNVPKGFVIDEPAPPRQISEDEIKTLDPYLSMFPDPGKEREKAITALELSRAISWSPSLVHRYYDQVMEKIDQVEAKNYPNGPWSIFWDAVRHSFPEKVGMMYKGAPAFTRGENIPGYGKWVQTVDELYNRVGDYLLSKRGDEEAQERVQEALQGPLWPKKEGGKFYQLDPEKVVPTITTWGAHVGDYIPIAAITGIAEIASTVTASLVAGGSAVATGPDISELMIYKVTKETVNYGLAGPALVAMEAGGFRFMTESLGIDPDISEKNQRLYGMSSGTVEYMQALWNWGPFRKLGTGLQTRLIGKVMVELGGDAMEGLEEMGQRELEDFFIAKCFEEQTERDPSYTVPEWYAPGSGWREFFVGAGIAAITRGGARGVRGIYNTLSPAEKTSLEQYGIEQSAMEEAEQRAQEMEQEIEEGEVKVSTEEAARRSGVEERLVAEEKPKQPWEMTREELEQDYGIEMSIPNNRQTPWAGEIPPIGSWRADPVTGGLEQLREVSVDELGFTEPEGGVRGRADYALYVRWAKEGRQAPPINVVKGADSGKWLSVNRRRVMAAQEVGQKTILAWVSDTDEQGRPSPQHEDVIRQALAEGKPVPAEVLAEYPDLAKAGESVPVQDIKSALDERGVTGDDLLDALDLKEDLEDKGGIVTREGMALLYHRTTPENAKRIIETGYMIGKEDRLFFGTQANGQIEGYGDAVVKVTIPLELLQLDDVFTNEAHVAYKTGAIGKPIKINVEFAPAVEPTEDVGRFFEEQAATEEKTTVQEQVLSEKLQRVQAQAEKRFEKQLIGKLLSGVRADTGEVEDVARILRDREVGAYKESLVFLDRIRDRGKIHVRYFKGAEELVDIPQWVKARVFTKSESASDFDEIAGSLGMSDTELIARLSEYRNIEKPSSRIKDYIEEAQREFEEDEAQFIRTTTGEITGKAIETAGKRGVTAGKKIGIVQEKERKRTIEINARARKVTRERVKKLVKDIKGIKTAKMAPQYAEPIEAIKDSVDLVKRQEKTVLRLEKIRNYLDNNPDAEMPQHVLDKLKVLDKKNLNDITVEELQQIHDTVMHYAHNDKKLKEIKVGREVKRAEEVLEDTLAVMKPPKQIMTELIKSHRGPVEKIKDIGKLIKTTLGIRHDHYDLIVEKAFGINTTPYKVLYTEVKKGILGQYEYEKTVCLMLQDSMEAELARQGLKIDNVWKWSNEKVKTGKVEFSRQERMALYNHWQNPDNRQAIIEGGFGLRFSRHKDHVYNLSEEELQGIIDSMTPEEVAVAGAPIRALFDTQGEAYEKAFYEANGYRFSREANYYPKDTMPIGRAVDLDLEEQTILEKFKGQTLRIGLYKGMLEKRRRVKLPIYLNPVFYDVAKSVKRASAYINLEMPLRNASKLMYNRTFKSEMIQRYGKETWDEIERALQDIALNHRSYTSVEKIAMRWKNKVATAMLGLDPFIMLKQIFSFPMYATYVKPKYLMQGMVDYMVNPVETIERHKMYDVEFDRRVAGGFSRDVADVYRHGYQRQLTGGGKTVQEVMMAPIQFADKNTVACGMQGAILQVLDEFNEGKLSREVQRALDISNSDIKNLAPEEQMKYAYDYARWVTERTQPMFAREHQSSLQAGSTFEQLMTMFGSFTNQALNLLRRTHNDAMTTGDPAAYKKLAVAVFTVCVVNPMGMIGINELKDKVYGRDDDEDKLWMEWVNSLAGYMFFVRDLSHAVTSKMQKGVFFGHDVSMPILRPVNLLATTIVHGYNAFTETKRSKQKKEAMKAIDDGLNLLLMSQGIPYYAPKKMIESALKVGGR